jgi:hypothetical protein
MKENHFTVDLIDLIIHPRFTEGNLKSLCLFIVMEAVDTDLKEVMNTIKEVETNFSEQHAI